MVTFSLALRTNPWLSVTCKETNKKTLYSCNKITTTQIQISRQNWNGFFSNNSHQMMIQLTPIVSRAKSKWYKPKKVKKLALNSQLLTVQILTNGVQVLILCPSYFITTVHRILYSQWNFCKIMSHCFHRNAHCDKIRPSRWCLHYCRNYLILSIYYPFWFKTDIIGEFICDRSIFQTFWKTHTLKSRALGSRPVYYSILKSFGQRSQYISIKPPLHKQSENP